MNNKGFALSGIIYGVLIIFIMLVLSVMSVLVVRGNTLFKIKENALNSITDNDLDDINMSPIIADFTTFNVTSDATNYVTLNYKLNVYSPYNYNITSSVSGNTITYNVYNSSLLVTTITKTLNNNAEALENDYEYKKESEKILLNPGLYKLEVWGASSSSLGSYASGYLYLEDKAIVYVNVGGKGRYGYNDGETTISYGEQSGVIISSNTGSNLIAPTSTPNTWTGNGKAKITSLIYFTK